MFIPLSTNINGTSVSKLLGYVWGTVERNKDAVTDLIEFLNASAPTLLLNKNVFNIVSTERVSRKEAEVALGDIEKSNIVWQCQKKLGE